MSDFSLAINTIEDQIQTQKNLVKQLIDTSDSETLEYSGRAIRSLEDQLDHLKSKNKTTTVVGFSRS